MLQSVFALISSLIVSFVLGLLFTLGYNYVFPYWTGSPVLSIQQGIVLFWLLVGVIVMTSRIWTSTSVYVLMQSSRRAIAAADVEAIEKAKANEAVR